MKMRTELTINRGDYSMLLEKEILALREEKTYMKKTVLCITLNLLTIYVETKIVVYRFRWR